MTSKLLIWSNQTNLDMLFLLPFYVVRSEIKLEAHTQTVVMTLVNSNGHLYYKLWLSYYFITSRNFNVFVHYNSRNLQCKWGVNMNPWIFLPRPNSCRSVRTCLLHIMDTDSSAHFAFNAWKSIQWVRGFTAMLLPMGLDLTSIRTRGCNLKGILLQSGVACIPHEVNLKMSITKISQRKIESSSWQKCNVNLQFLKSKNWFNVHCSGRWSEWKYDDM